LQPSFYRNGHWVQGSALPPTAQVIAPIRGWGNNGS